jgi:ceramide glucosyltransferase
MAHEIVRWALLALALAPFGYYVLAIAASRRFFCTRPPVRRDFAPPISILKPVRGLDREAYENYASFCRQQYPEFEIIFGVTERSDPAVPVIQRLMRDFPRCDIRLLIGAEPLGSSDKVNKLCRMAREARHEILIISDSDIRVAPGYLYAIAAPFADPMTGAVTCLYRGITDGSLVSEMESIGNTSDFDAGVLSAWQLGRLDFTLGATMATTKEILAEIGGFESLAGHCSDDYELGHRIAALGYRVEVTPFPVFTVFPAQTLRQCFRHQFRWALTMKHTQPGGHFSLLFTQGLPWAVLAALIAPGRPLAALYLCGYAVLRTAMAWAVGIRGLNDGLLRRKMWLVPLRDAFAFIVWLASFFNRRIEWRGSEYYIRDKCLVPAADSAIVAEQPAA